MFIFNTVLDGFYMLNVVLYVFITFVRGLFLLYFLSSKNQNGV